MNILNKQDAATAAAKSLQLCLTLCDPIDGSPPGSPVLGILQARILERVAIPFSNARMHAKSLQSSCHIPTPNPALLSLSLVSATALLGFLLINRARLSWPHQCPQEAYPGPLTPLLCAEATSSCWAFHPSSAVFFLPPVNLPPHKGRFVY